MHPTTTRRNERLREGAWRATPVSLLDYQGTAVVWQAELYRRRLAVACGGAWQSFSSGSRAMDAAAQRVCGDDARAASSIIQYQ
jgi:hypothetical protein